MQRAADLIREQLSDASFGVQAFAECMCISRSVLLKKIEALAGEPPSELIKRARLRRGAELLLAHAGNVSEIALEVGFGNPGYFSECFRKEFGITPTGYQQSVQNPAAGDAGSSLP